MVGELDELSMCSADVSELGSAELGEIGLCTIVSSISFSRGGVSYIDIKPEDGVFATTSFQRSDLCLQLVLRDRSVLPCAVVSSSTGPLLWLASMLLSRLCIVLMSCGSLRLL